MGIRDYDGNTVAVSGSAVSDFGVTDYGLFDILQLSLVQSLSTMLSLHSSWVFAPSWVCHLKSTHRWVWVLP